jgi:hypothetical protein
MITHLQHFSLSEFREWSGDMSPRLVVMLDVLRHMLGSPIEISAHPDALGRKLGLSESAHNVDFWGEVLAVDCFVRGVYYRAQAAAVVEAAKIVGFTGIGIYPYWKNNKGETQAGFHFDVRPTRKMGMPATWAYYDGKSVSIEHGLNKLEARA